MHEEPQVPNYVTPAAKRIALREGMTLALEPMITQARRKSPPWTTAGQSLPQMVNSQRTSSTPWP